MTEVTVIKSILVESKELKGKPYVVMMRHSQMPWDVYSVKQGNYFWVSRGLARRTWSTRWTCEEAIEKAMLGEAKALCLPIKAGEKYIYCGEQY